MSLSVACERTQIRAVRLLVSENNHVFGLIFIDDATLEENFAVLTNNPDCRKCERFLREVGLESGVQLGCGIGLQLRGMRNETDERRQYLFSDKVSGLIMVCIWRPL